MGTKMEKRLRRKLLTIKEAGREEGEENLRDTEHGRGQALGIFMSALEVFSTFSGP